VRWGRWVEDGAIYLAVGLALAAGLAASYGRELEASRSPDRKWWARRLLIMPLLAITATAAADFLRLGASVTAFTAAMLSLGGYDALCVLEKKWQRALAGAAATRGANERGPDGPLPRD
jgi:hypothetical protein